MTLPLTNTVAHGERTATDEEYYHLLFMRAHLIPPYDPPDSSLMRIPASEYAFLTRSLGEYLNLRKNLLENGVTLSALEMYIQSRAGSPVNTSQSFSGYSNTENASVYAGMDHNRNHGTGIGSEACGSVGKSRVDDKHRQPFPMTPGSTASATATKPHSTSSQSFLAQRRSQTSQSPMPDQFDPKPTDGKTYEDGSPSETNRPPRDDQRTLRIAGLSPETTLNDVIEHVRGGMVLDISRWNDRTAYLSFFRGSDARAFRAYARHCDIYINNKRVTVDWADRQFLPNVTTYNKIINNGVTRILRLRNAVGVVDEQTVREDMEHIHRLFILKVMMDGNDLIIHTNSIQGCGFARTCMLSRMPYRALKSDFVPDECAKSLPHRLRPNYPNAVQSTSQHRSKLQKSVNLYDVLNSEDSEDDSYYGNLKRTGRHDSALIDSSSSICKPR